MFFFYNYLANYKRHGTHEKLISFNGNTQWRSLWTVLPVYPNVDF